MKREKSKSRGNTASKKSKKDTPVEEDSESEYETYSESELESEDIEDTEDEDETEDDTEDEEEMENFIVNDDTEQSDCSPQSLRKTVAELFPSKYMDKRVKADRKMEELISKDSKKKKNEKQRKATYNTRSMKKNKYSSESEEDEEIVRKSSGKDKSKKEKSKSKSKNKETSDEDSDEDSEEDSDYDPDEKKKKKQNINIIFGFGANGQAGDEEEMEDEHALLDEEDCDTDDEKMFMKETYQTIELPEQISEETKKSKKSEKKRRKPVESITDTEEQNIDTLTNKTKFETEYNELIEMKKYLAENMKKNPKSKMWLKSLENCNNNINKLVKKERGKNTKEYHKMIHCQDRKFTSEIEYFKKKLSNQEQQRVMKDLKSINEHIQIDKPYRLSLLESNIPAKYKATVLQKLNILRTMEPGDPEYYKMKNWIDTFMRIPIGIYKSLSVNMSDGTERCQEFMEKSIQSLDACVYGLNDAKMQIIQMIGQWMTNPKSMGTAIAIKGPPGTGKTSLVKEGISKILGREFAFIALGGAGDASFLEGHSYTYEGSSWGKILQIIIDSKCMNPVIYFDELDKLSDSPRGVEIASILTHLTDTSQNSEFHDKYFSEMSFDLSKCLFIFSYNDENNVNPILRDRMYRIQTKGYSAKEKITIAKNYMLPKIREQVNFDEGMIVIPDDTLEYIITKPSFTKSEEGVRNLKRCLEIIHTKLNLFRLIKPDNTLFANEIKLKVEFPFTVTRSHADLLIKDDDPLNQSMLAMYV